MDDQAQDETDEAVKFVQYRVEKREPISHDDAKDYLTMIQAQAKRRSFHETNQTQ